MKTKLLSFISIAVIMASCTLDPVENYDNQAVSTQKNATIRSYVEALEIAQNSISLLDGAAKTRGTVNNRIIDLSEKKVFKLDALTRTESNVNDTLIYVFNFENNEGFALVSASKATEGLLAITEEGYCNPDETSGIDGFDLFLEMAKKYVRDTEYRYEPIDSNIQHVNIVCDTTITYVNPLLTVQWGQEMIAGEFFPNGVAGPQNVAIAQVMTYYGHPSNLDLTYEDAYVTQTELNWPLIRTHNFMHSITYCTDTTTHKQIARLVRQIGDLSDSYFLTSPNRTGTRISSRTVFANLGYTVGDDTSYNAISVRSELNNQHLIFMEGYRLVDGTHFVGSNWIIDGYYDTSIKQYEYHGYGVVPKWQLVQTYGPFITRYNHINWGWYGHNNGYFYNGVFDSSQVYNPDTNNNEANVNYNVGIKMHYVYKN